jgi:ABC-type glycerol-3-phosphate transport system substrate-binding protein
MNRSPLTIRRRLAAALIGATLVVAACGSSDDSADTTDAPADTVASTEAAESTDTTDAPESTEAPATTEAASDGVRRVPGDYPTIQ